MSEKFSSMIANFLLCHNIIQEEDREIYQYGYETLLYSIGQTFVLLLLGGMLGKWIESVVFIIVFATLRRCTGGYHANTRFGCMLMTVIAYMTVLLLQEIPVRISTVQVIFLFFLLFYLLVFITYAPVEHENKPLTDRQRKRYKKQGSGLSILYLFVAVLTFKELSPIAFTIILTMAMTALLMIIHTRRGGKG